MATVTVQDHRLKYLCLNYHSLSIKNVYLQFLSNFVEVDYFQAQFEKIGSLCLIFSLLSWSESYETKKVQKCYQLVKNQYLLINLMIMIRLMSKIYFNQKVLIFLNRSRIFLNSMVGNVLS